MTRDETQRFFERRLDAWKRRDVEALTAHHSEDCVLESPVAGEVRGRAAIESVYRGFLASFPDLVLTSPELIIDDDRVVQVVTFSGTNSGGFMSLPPTGKHFSFLAVLMCTMRDGQIVHQKSVYDFTRFLIEIGVLKAKPV